jgi:hypothetical protein
MFLRNVGWLSLSRRRYISETELFITIAVRTLNSTVPNSLEGQFATIADVGFVDCCAG